MQAIQSKDKPDPKARKPLEPLPLDALALYDIGFVLWRVFVKGDVTPAELDMHPTYWNLLSGKDGVHEGSEINAIWNNGKYLAKYVIVNVANGVVAVRLAYEVEGAPLMSATGPRAFPSGYHIEKARLEEGHGFLVVRESDGMRILTSGGVPWKSYQEAFEQFPKLAMFRNEKTPDYLP